MNKCFFAGRIITNVRFEFVLNGYHDSVAIFKLQLFRDNEIVNVNAYDDLADFCYRYLEKGSLIILEGSLTSKYAIAKKIKKMKGENKDGK